jgi:hypothetical protein
MGNSQPVDCKPVDCKPVDCKPVSNVYKSNFFEIEASLGENIDAQYKNNLNSFFQNNTINVNGQIMILPEVWTSYYLTNIIIDIQKKFPNHKGPLINIKITNIKNKNGKISGGLTFIPTKDDSDIIDVDNIISSSDKEGTYTENIIDMTNKSIFNFKNLTMTNFKTIKLINIPLNTIFDRKMFLVNDRFSIQMPDNIQPVKKVITSKQSFENVNETSNYYIIILTIILLIAFINRERLMKMIKG